MRALLLCAAILWLGQVYGQTCPATGKHEAVAQWQRTKTYNPNYFYIAGLFSVREAGASGGKCGGFRFAGIQFIEAFLWAVRTAQSRTGVLNGFTDVAAVGFDVCATADLAVEQVLNFEKCTVRYGGANGYPTVKPTSTYAYIGPEGNVLSGVSQLISSLPKTDVAVTSTHSYLTKPGWSEYQMRTVASDAKQIAAIIAVLKNEKLAIVQVVYSSSMMGRDRYDKFKEMAKKDVCIEQALMINPTDNENVYRDMVRKLLTKKRTRAVVLLLDDKLTEIKSDTYQVWKVLKAVELERVQGTFTWFSTDAWDVENLELKGLETAAAGAVIVAPALGNPPYHYNAFSNYFRNLKPTTNTDNPWFKEFWETKFSCRTTGSTNLCTSQEENLWKQLRIDERVTYIIQAVDAVVKGVEAMRNKTCLDTTMCGAFVSKPNIMAEVASSIKAAKTLDGKNVFDSRGDAYITRFKIINIQRLTSGTPDIKEVMTYTQDGTNAGVLSTQKSIIAYDERMNRIPILKSKCNNPCTACPLQPLFTAAPKTEDPNLPNLQTTLNYSKLSILLPQKPVRDEIWVIPLMILAGLGIFIVICFEIYVLSKLIGTKAIRKWRTMWLGQLLLLSVILAYVVCFMFVPTPTVATCGIIRFGVGASYSMIYAILLVKLMIVLSSKSIGYLRGVYQVLMFLFAWAVQLVVDAEWLILVPPKVAIVDGKWQCIHNTLVAGQERLYTAHVISLVYCMFLIVICTLISIRTHGITTNHREGIFVGLAAGFSVPLWLAWILVGQLNSNREFEDPAVAYGLFLTATLVLFVMFLPKVRQLNTLGVEGIYLEDDQEADRDVYGSVMYGPPSYRSNRPGSVYMINGDTYANVNPAFLNNSATLLSQSEYSPDPHYGTVRNAGPKHSLYLRHPGSTKSGPTYTKGGGSMYGTKVLRTTRDLTGRFPLDNKRAASEYGFATTKTIKTENSIKAKGTLKRAHSLTDLGAL